MPTYPECKFEVIDGVGRVGSNQITTDFIHDGKVDIVSIDYDPETDPPPDRVFVEDLEQREVEFFEIGEPQVATQTLSVLNPPFMVVLTGYNEIELDDPTQLGEPTRRLARWRFRFNEVLTDPLETFTYEFRTHPYTRALFTDYSYILTAADLAAGWTTHEDVFDEHWWISGGISAPSVEPEPPGGTDDDGGSWDFFDAFGIPAPWFPDQNRFFLEGSVVSGGGFMWRQTGEGFTGLTEPDWAGGTPGPISDGPDTIAWVLVDIWTPSTPYTTGDLIQPATFNGYAYVAASDFTSDTVEPTWGMPDVPLINNGNMGWRVSQIGEGMAELSLIVDGVPGTPGTPFAIDDGFYNVEMLWQGTTLSAKVWSQSGAVPGSYQVTEVAPAMFNYANLFWIDTDALLIRDAPMIFAEWDEVKIWGPLETAEGFGLAEFGLTCEPAARLTSTLYELTNTYLPNSSEVWIDDLRERIGPDYSESPTEGRVEFASDVDSDAVVYVCYMANGRRPE